MSCNWAGSLDMLAQNGVIDFDAASYIMGQPLRYVGNPAHPNPFNGQPPTMTNLQQPNIDEFKPQTDKDKSPKLPMWKKLAFAAIAVGGLAIGGYKFRAKLIPFIKKQFGKINLTNAKNFIVNKSKSIGGFFKTGWNKFTGLFHKKP